MGETDVKLKLPLIGKVFNGVALLSFLSSLIYIIVKWSSLPERVPSHYNAFGEPDAWSNKVFIFFPISIGFMLWVGCYFIEKHPHIHNYIWLTSKNKFRLYRNSMLMINFIKNEILLYFSFNIWNDVHVAKGNEPLFDVWQLPIFLFVLFGTLFYFIFRSFKLR